MFSRSSAMSLTLHDVDSVGRPEQCPPSAAVQNDRVYGFFSSVAPHDSPVDGVVGDCCGAGAPGDHVRVVVASVASYESDKSRTAVSNEEEVTWF